MSRLFIVSNRVADIEKGAQSGGLAVALGDALKSGGGVWFGWDGNIVEDGGSLDVTTTQLGPVTIATVPLTQADYDEYYLGFANKVLWPVCHYRLDLSQFETAFYDGYRRVNARFAREIAKLVQPHDYLWVHDYHLMSLAAELRHLGVGHKIGFFLHIPFPPPEMIMAIPVHDWLIEALFQFDVLGFQTSADAANFRRFVEDNYESTSFNDGTVRAFGRTVYVSDFPIGIDVDTFTATAQTPEAVKQIELLKRGSLRRENIIGVDRLDYTKGLPERLKAFRRLLELYPENMKRVTLMQIAPPTRIEVEAYANIREELEGVSGAINGAYGDFDWTPVRYIHRNVPRDTLAALFRGSHVGLVTPLRDGMNLVAKEYVAAQDGEDPGVLILSRFAGAAEDMQEAIIINPYDIDDMAHAMQAALNMPLQERQERHAALLTRVRKNDVRYWREDFLNVLMKDETRALA